MTVNDFDSIQFLLTGAGGAGAAVLFAIALLRKNLLALAQDIARTERNLAECRRVCDERMEKTGAEYKQIICALNEIKVQLVRTETLALMRQGPFGNSDSQDR